MEKLTHFAGVACLALFAAACSDQPPPTEPDGALQPQFAETAPHVGELFFFGPPVGDVQDRSVAFDPEQLPVLVFEICPKGEFGDGDVLTDSCSEPLGRWDSDGGPDGNAIEVVSEDADDWYRIVVDFEALDLGGRVPADFVGRVILGDPTGGSDDELNVYGHFEFGAHLRPTQARPVKWWLGEGSADALLCQGAEPCNSEVITDDQGGRVVLEDDGEILGGIELPPGSLPDGTAAVVVTVQLGQEPCLEIDQDGEPLPVGLPQFGDCLDVSTDPDISGQELDGEATVSICLDVPDGLLNEAQEDLLQIHRSSNGETEALPNVSEAICPDATGMSRTDGGVFAHGWRLFRETVLSWAAPTPVHAADLGLGGETGFMSNFKWALPAEMKILQGNAETESAGSDVDPDPTIEVTDSNGDAVTGATVLLEVTGGGGSVSETEVTTGADGRATWDWTLGSEPGTTNTMRVTGVGIAGPQDPGPFTDVGDTNPVDLLIRTLDFTAFTSIENGSFESPKVSTEEGWDVFDSKDTGWNIEWVGGSDTFEGHERPSEALLEFLENGVVGDAAEGNQKVELDSDWTGPRSVSDPSFTGEPANVKISQELVLSAGVTYELSYSWRARTDTDRLLVTFGAVSDTHDPGVASGSWSPSTLTFTPAEDGTVELSFEEEGPADALGTLLDAVSVTVSPNEE